jgi:hypothetical protein
MDELGPRGLRDLVLPGTIVAHDELLPPPVKRGRGRDSVVRIVVFQAVGLCRSEARFV